MTKIGASLLGLALLAPVPGHAALVLVTQQTNDAAFENAGGFLQTFYGLPLAGNTALPPLERAVAQFTGSTTSNNTALYTPNVTTGIPFQGAGVTQALTNVTPIASAQTAWVSGTPVAFTYQRMGNTVTYTLGSFTASDTQTYYSSIDGIELRARSMAPNAAYSSDSLSFSNLLYTDTVTASQSLPAVTASNGDVLLTLYSGVVGDFRLTGKATLAWAGPANPVNPPGNSNMNAQIKGLDLPAPVPEPASFAMLGFGQLVFAALRRRG